MGDPREQTIGIQAPDVTTPSLDQTIPGLDQTTPGLDQTTTGLDKTTTGLEETPKSLDETTDDTTTVRNNSVILISKIKPAFTMNFSVSLHPEEETTTNLIKLETGDREGKPYLTLDLTEKNLILKCSNFSLKSQVKDPSSFYVEISQFYARTRGKVSAKSIKIVK